MAGLYPGISEISNGEIKLERELDKSELDLEGLLKGSLLQRGWFEATREREEEKEVWGEYECCGVSCREICAAIWGTELAS